MSQQETGGRLGLFLATHFSPAVTALRRFSAVWVSGDKSVARPWDLLSSLDGLKGGEIRLHGGAASAEKPVILCASKDGVTRI